MGPFLEQQIRRLRPLLAGVLGLGCALAGLRSQTFVEWRNGGTNDLDSTANWTGDALPDNQQVAKFNSATFSPNNLHPQSSSMSLAGILLTTGSGDLTFTSSGGGSAKTITLGASGVVNSSASTLTFDVTSKVNLALAADATFEANGAIVIRDETNRGSTSGFSIGTHTLTLSGTSNASLIEKGISPSTGSVIKTGPGTWTISGANSYTGTTTLSGGTLAISILANGGTASGLGKSGNAAANLIFDGGTLRYTDAAVSTDRQFTLAAKGGTIDASGTGALTLAATGAVSLGGSNTSPVLTLTGTNTGNNTFAGTLGNNGSGSSALVKSGAGTWVLTGQNTYAGGTSVQGGTLRLGVAGALPSTTLLSLYSGAVLDVLHNQTVAGFASGTSGEGATLQLGNGATFTVAMPVANESTTFAGSVTGNGIFAVSGAGNDVVNLTGSVAGSITTQVGSGATLVIGSGGDLTGPLQLGEGSTFSLNQSGSQTISGIISGAGSLQATSGTTILSGANTYTGSTTITGGTLLVTNTSGSGTGTGTVTVGSGGTFGGTGIITGPLQLNSGGILSPGASPGNLTVGPTTWAGDAHFTFEINDGNGTAGSQWDLLTISGALTINATPGNPFILDLVSLTTSNAAGLLLNFDPANAASWVFATASGGIAGFETGAFQYNTSQFQNGLADGHFFVSQSGNNLLLNFTPVPEPSTWAMLGAGLGLLLLFGRRRKA
jgi:fibronectin-binding autotransporter adhesin